MKLTPCNGIVNAFHLNIFENEIIKFQEISKTSQISSQKKPHFEDMNMGSQVKKWKNIAKNEEC